MHPKDVDDCRRYVEGELDRVVRSRSGWFASPAIAHASEPPPTAPRAEVSAAWRIRQGSKAGAPWYLLEASLGDQEFRIWFGNHQVGVAGLSWIMRPAVHVAFDSLTPMERPFELGFSLGDVLEAMIASPQGDGFARASFALNTYSLT